MLLWRCCWRRKTQYLPSHPQICHGIMDNVCVSLRTLNNYNNDFLLASCKGCWRLLAFTMKLLKPQSRSPGNQSMTPWELPVTKNKKEKKKDKILDSVAFLPLLSICSKLMKVFLNLHNLCLYFLICSVVLCTPKHDITSACLSFSP